MRGPGINNIFKHYIVLKMTTTDPFYLKHLHLIIYAYHLLNWVQARTLATIIIIYLIYLLKYYYIRKVVTLTQVGRHNNIFYGKSPDDVSFQKQINNSEQSVLKL